MLSDNLKRTVATLGVVAGLLAAAVPASAGPAAISGYEMTDAIAAPDAPKAAAKTDAIIIFDPALPT